MKLGTRWIELIRRNQVKSISIQKLRTANSLWFVLEKMQKLRTANVGMETRFTVLKRFSQGSKYILISLRPRHLSTDWRRDLKQERRGKTPLEGEFEEELKNRARNRRSSWFILFFTLFSCCTIV
jgi:hypothetical protein